MTDLEFWTNRLDELKARLTPSTDVEVSYLIRVSTAMISQIRTDRSEVPFESKIKILEALGYVFDHDLLIRLLPADHRRVICEAMRRSDASSLVKLTSANTGRELPELPA